MNSAALVHDLKTPLTAIEGYAQIMLSASPTEKQASYLEGILSSGYILRTLIDNLSEGRGVDDKTGTLSKILESVAAKLSRAFHAKNSTVSVSAPDISLRRGAGMVEQIAANLLITALYTIRTGSNVEVSGDSQSLWISGEFSGAPPHAISLIEKVAKITREPHRVTVLLPPLS